jgi:hypothetical protein
MDGSHKFDNYWLNLGQFLQTNYNNSISFNRNLEETKVIMIVLQFDETPASMCSVK